ncbi:hypothetical protein ABIA39_003625 [Nocardia sp. GAS34]|uniref:cell division protein PerM n=1 Tax=unclassified Nocardia TaxID=2637762 RepID=UPI003D24E08F
MKASPIRWDPRNARSPQVDPDHDPGPEDNLFLSPSPERARVLLIVAARATSFTVVIIVALVILTLLAANSTMTGASGAIAAGWLAVHQVPLVVGKTTLSLLPLAPTGLVLWLTARDCARAVESDSSGTDLGWILGAALSGPLLVTAVCLAVADDASSVVALQPPQALAAFAWVVGLHLLAAVAGIASRPNPLRDRLLAELPPWAAPAARAARRTVRRLLLGGLLVTVVSFLVHWSRIGDTYRAAGNIGGVFGLTLLSLAYLPNTVIGAAAVLVGADVHIGAGGLSVFSIASAPVPALPVLAAVPAGPAAVWWPVLLLAPAAVGVLAGMECARESGDQARRPWATLSAAGLTALAMLVAGGIAGGTVGSFGDIGPGMFTFAGLTLLWLAIPGYVGLLCTRWFLPAPVGGRRVGEYSDNVDEYDDDYDRDYAEDEYAEDEYDDEYDYADDEYADTDEGYDDDYADPDRPYADDDYGYDDYDPHNASDPATIDGELVEEQPALGTRHRVGGRANETDDILDAEVVETDPQGRGEAEGR